MKKCPIWVRFLVAILAVIYMMAGLALVFFTAKVYRRAGVAVPVDSVLIQILAFIMAMVCPLVLHSAIRNELKRPEICFLGILANSTCRHIPSSLFHAIPWYIDLAIVALWVTAYYGVPDIPRSLSPLPPITPPLPPLKLSEWNWRMKP